MQLPDESIAYQYQGLLAPAQEEWSPAAELRASHFLPAAELRDLTLELYRRARAHAEKCGILLADTKLEFGTSDGRVVWIDEAFTPDSSRFWPRDGYQPGRAQPSFDKQYVRDYLETLDWDKRPPGPPLPEDVVTRTREKYLEAFARLTGTSLTARGESSHARGEER